jgi:hypothetical protein
MEDSMRLPVIAAAMVVAMGATAHADVIGSAPAFASGQTVAVCYYSNIGTAAVNFTDSVIIAEPGVVLPEASEFCGGSIGPGRCRTVANVPGNAAVWCRAVVDNKRNLRGRLEIRNASNVTLTAQEAR